MSKYEYGRIDVLARKLECEVRSSALSSGGKRPCSFLFTILDSEVI